MPLLIATDEAGYGPKLGPLVIVASVWQFPSPETTQSSQTSSAGKYAAGDYAIGDSKQVFKRSATGSLSSLEIPIVAFLGNLPEAKSITSLEQFLTMLAPGDVRPLYSLPWFKDLSNPFPAETAPDSALEKTEPTADGYRLLSLSGRVIDAKRFNDLCDQCGNKATLLSEATVALTAKLIAATSETEIAVYSDRHGGRRHYAGLLQQAFPEHLCRVVSEAPACSRYELNSDSQRVEWRFTVKGDQFPPVGFSSMVAKYVRERLMGCLNNFWASHHSGELKPTAGYPVDAERFCQQIAGIAQKLSIAERDYIRLR